ncbi:putative gustatory receptor 28b isoform X2 [Pseudomyrmex gracilis]|uniref:putative gustatory receptor 28b isoform X2 n=1 Tax=Pseudomyrmex gracilis TaxID=219809 RepID=UPI0009955E67|nr:putative gustatory receptor 28b isoform X2 [Pseudomyrmex gracilis]
MAPMTLKNAVEPILWLNRIFCMGIFEIPTNNPQLIFSVLYVILVSIGYFVLFYNLLVIFQLTLLHDFAIFFFVLGVNIFVAGVAIILYWYKSENLLIIIKKMNYADSTLETLGIHQNYRKLFHRIISILIFYTILMLLLSVMHLLWIYSDVNVFGLTVLTTICFCFPIMVNFVVDVTFISTIMKFKYTNYLINKVVACANESSDCKTFRDKRENTPITIYKAQYKNNKHKMMHLIQILRQLHLEFTKISRLINDTFCAQLLLEFAVHFTVVTACSYNLYAAFTGKIGVSFGTEKIISTIIWGSVYSLKVIFVNNMCNNLAAEAYKTGEIIQSFAGSAIDDEVREEIQQFTQQIMLNALNFTAAGFFTIDNSFTGKFFATVTTYVVILIQINPPI